jgi:taurine transport system substrate-binding protein
MLRLVFLLVGVLVVSCTSCTGPNAATPTEATVTVGYQGMINPWKSRMRTGHFEKATGRKIVWRRFNSGAEVILAMASGDVDLAVAGSSPIATALCQGLDIKLVWIVEAIDTAEALIARNSTGIKRVEDLAEKRVGVPFASTTHYHLLVALERAGVDPGSPSILNLQPAAIAASWEQGHIDAAFVWSPVLDRLRKSGTALVSSGELAAAGRPTFDGLVARGDFVSSNAGFLEAFVRTMAEADDAYRANKATWTPESPAVTQLSAVTGASAAIVPTVLAQYVFPDPATQASSTWLGGGGDGGAAKALADTSRFLKEQGKVRDVLESYGASVLPTFAAAATKETP